jgi:hypothetical protein
MHDCILAAAATAAFADSRLPWQQLLLLLLQVAVVSCWCLVLLQVLEVLENKHTLAEVLLLLLILLLVLLLLRLPFLLLLLLPVEMLWVTMVVAVVLRVAVTTTR